MTMIQRRALLGALAGSATGLLGACGGGGSDSAEAAVAAAPSDPAPVDAPAPVSVASDAVPDQTAEALVLTAASVARYRSNHRYLFQTVKTKLLKTRLPGGADLLMDTYGPTSLYVDFRAGWPWTRAGGDWIDAGLVRHGSQPWFSAPVGAVLGGTAIHRYTMDVTRAVAHCQVSKRWCALLLTSTAPRAIAAMTHPSEPAPYLLVTYQNGMQARLNCRMVAANTASATGPATMLEQVSLPAFTEFEPPAGPITKAQLFLSVTQHWSGSNPQLRGWIIDPPVNRQPVQAGLAATAGTLDATLASHPQVIGVHRYLDGTTIEDFSLPGAMNFYAEKNFDPAIYGTGPRDTTKLPHLGLGKWIRSGDDPMRVVPSTYTGEGFAPLAPGLGALRIPMPAAPGVTDGSVVGSGGTTAGNAMIFLPEPLFGRLPRLFVRYYVRIGGTGRVTTADRKQVYHVAGQAPVWTNSTGKFGIAADHSTFYGGGSGSAGGGNGWQMRHGWYDCDADTGGPDEGGWSPGFHMYDFYYANPPGHNYGKSDSTPSRDQWGQQGGLGGMFYAGQWYCVETELKLNTVSTTAPGFVPDGELRVWIDGRLAYVRTGMVFRTGPVKSYPYHPDRIRPCRDLGVRGLWLNWFHGGKTQNTVNRSLFYTGLAYGQQYIGPMNL
jgi:hypothetical protein